MRKTGNTRGWWLRGSFLPSKCDDGDVDDCHDDSDDCHDEYID